MTIRWQVGAYFVLFLFQVESQSPSTPFLSRNTSSSANMATSSTPSRNTSSSANMATSSTPSARDIPSTGRRPDLRCNVSKLNVCWLHSPPYLIKDSNRNISGIFHQAINEIFSECCNSSSMLNYVHEARNFEEQKKCMQEPKQYDIVFPLLYSNIQSLSYASTFQRLIGSPGIAVVKNRNFLEQRAKSNVLQEISQSWTVLLLALILCAIFGILVWALVSITFSLFCLFNRSNEALEY